MSFKLKEILRREFLDHSAKTTGSASLGLAASILFSKSHAVCAFNTKSKIKIGQIGTVHPHAAGKMAALRKLTVQMGYMFRHNPAFRFCFKAVYEGWIGEIFEVQGVISKTVSSATRKKLYARGSMFELGCHLIDLLVTILGKPDYVTAYLRRIQPEQDNIADNQLAVFEYPKATATMRSAIM